MQAIKLFKFTALAALAAAALLCACGEKSPRETAEINKKKSELAVRRAQVMLADNKIKDAIAMLENAYSECGANPKVCEALANAFVQDGRTAAAGVFFEQTFDGDNSRPEFLIFAANAYEQTNNLEAASLAYEKYLKAVPRDAPAMKNYAKILQKMGVYDKALNMRMAAIKASKQDPDTAEAAVIGGLFAKLGNAAQAKLWLETALSVTMPENISTRREIYLNLIDVYLERREMDNLEKTIAALDAIDPKIVNEKFPTLKANLAEFKHKLAEAEAIVNADTNRKSLELEQDAENSERAKADEQRAKEEEAKKTAQAQNEKPESKPAQPSDAAKTTPPADAQAKAEPATADAAQAKTEGAKEAESAGGSKPEADAKQAAEAAPQPAKSNAENPLRDAAPVESIARQSPEAPAQAHEQPKREEADLQRYIRLAREAIAKKQKREALEFANGAVANGSLSPEAWFAMAEAFELNGAADDAYLAANEAYLIDTSNRANAIKFLHFASLEKSGETFLASALSILKKFPNSAEACYYAGLAHEKSGDMQNAKKMYQKFLQLDGSDTERAKRAEGFIKNN